MRMTIEIDTQEEKKARAVAQALAEDAKPKRGKVKFTGKGTRLVLDFDCEDKVALRAAVNSSLRLTDACLSIIQVK